LNYFFVYVIDKTEIDKTKRGEKKWEAKTEEVWLRKMGNHREYTITGEHIIKKGK
jgi:hypothetical protein